MTDLGVSLLRHAPVQWIAALRSYQCYARGREGTTGRGGDFERPWAPQVGNFWQTLNINAGPGIGKFEQC